MPDGKIEFNGPEEQPYESKIPKELEKVLLNKEGVKETLEFESFVLSLLKSLKEAKENDGKIDFKDAGKFFDPVTKVIPGFIGVNKIPQELLFDQVTKEERALLIQKAKEYGVLDEKAEKLVDDVLGYIEHTKRLVDEHIHSFL